MNTSADSELGFLDFDVNKLEAMRERAAQQRAILRDINDRRTHARERWIDRRARAEAYQREAWGQPSPELARLLAGDEAELKRLDEAVAEQSPRILPFLELVARLETWARRHGRREDAYLGNRELSHDPRAIARIIER